MTREVLRAALSDRNVKAFLQVIRAGEGTLGSNGYRTLFGGKLFDSFADHPNVTVQARGYTSTAAGAYQFLHRTWRALVNAWGFEDFSPACQDEGAVALISGRQALDAVKAGRLAEAIQLCNKEWASLSGSPYGQPTRTLREATKTYLEAGGELASTEATPPPETAMPLPLLPFISAALPALVQAAPALIRIFGSSPQAEKNAQAAQVVATIAKEATGETTVEGAVQAIQEDPAKAAAYREAVHQSMGELVGYMIQAQEADDKSRDKAVDRNLQLAKASKGRWLYLLGAVALIVVGMSYWITWGVLFNAVSTFSDETKAMLLGQIVILGFVTVLGFLYGSNIQNRISQEREAKP